MVWNVYKILQILNNFACGFHRCHHLIYCSTLRNCDTVQGWLTCSGLILFRRFAAMQKWENNTSYCTEKQEFIKYIPLWLSNSWFPLDLHMYWKWSMFLLVLYYSGWTFMDNLSITALSIQLYWFLREDWLYRSYCYCMLWSARKY